MTLLWLLLFADGHGNIVVGILSGCGGLLFLGRMILGGGYALLPEDALWRRFCPVALLVFCRSFIGLFWCQVAAFNLLSSNRIRFSRLEVVLLAVSWMSPHRTGLSARCSFAMT
jgi:hypothetical protein